MADISFRFIKDSTKYEANVADSLKPPTPFDVYEIKVDGREIEFDDPSYKSYREFIFKVFIRQRARGKI